MAIAGIGELKSELIREYGEEENEAVTLESALRRLDGVIARLNGEFDEQLDAVLGEGDPQRHAVLLPVVQAAADEMETFITQDQMMASPDANEYLPDMRTVEPLLAALAEMRAALSA